MALKKKYYATYRCLTCGHGEYIEIPKGRKECVMCGGSMAHEARNISYFEKKFSKKFPKSTVLTGEF